MKQLHLGILGTGNISHQFAKDMDGAERCVLRGVGSRSQSAANAFASQFRLSKAYGTYDAILDDADIDAIYIGLPNALHHKWTLKALAAGKHVLCEKPMAANAAETEEMFDQARRHGCLLVEAYMYRSHPLLQAVIEELNCGAIGRLKLIRMSFSYCTRKINDNIRFSPELAGGALMDIGCYCIDLARLLCGGDPLKLYCTAHVHKSGVDEYAAGTLHFANEVLASFVCGMTVQTNNAALICGDEGFIEIPVPWKPPIRNAQFIISSMAPPCQDRDNKTGLFSPAMFPKRKVVQVDAPKPLYALEIDDFAAAVLDGTKPVVSKDASIGNMRVLDELRRQAGLPI